MTHTYEVSGMTCAKCEAELQTLLENVGGVRKASIDRTHGEAVIEMDHHISTSQLQMALKQYPKYQLTEKENNSFKHTTKTSEEEPRSWLSTYKPLLLTFGFILGITLLLEAKEEIFSWTRWMDYFMAGFFLAFSFFKLLDLRGFAENYATYDIIARRWMPWGYVYAFIELGLGLAFLTGINPLLTNLATLLVMTVSIIGVLQSVLNQRKIRCACLGAVFNLPMSTLTITEDALMILMSSAQLLTLI